MQACYLRCFSTPDGEQVLKNLQIKFKENTEPLSSDAIRHSIGQRSVLKFIQLMVDKGRGTKNE